MKSELLAPAKDKQTAIEAINCGADAVYMGASCFGARKNAPNSLDDIKEVVRHAHKFWAKVFITVNTILNDEELEEAVELVNATVGENLVKLSTFEISTEYIKFNSDKKFSEGQSFECELIIPKNHGIIKFRATVVEIDPVYDDEYKAVYSNMTEEDRQTLLYYMYLYSNNTD